MTVLDRPASSSWLELAACRGKPLSWWYPERGDRFAGAVAKAICRSCPVRLVCLAYALEHDGDHPAGIFGGLSADQRARLRRRQRGSCDHECDHGGSTLSLPGHHPC